MKYETEAIQLYFKEITLVGVIDPYNVYDYLVYHQNFKIDLEEADHSTSVLTLECPLFYKNGEYFYPIFDQKLIKGETRIDDVNDVLVRKNIGGLDAIKLLPMKKFLKSYESELSKEEIERTEIMMAIKESFKDFQK